MTATAKLPAAMDDDGELQDFDSTRDRKPNAAGRQALSDNEWRAAVAALTEVERAPYDEPHVYADVH